jgi:uncharacterized membrane protein
VQHVVYFNFTIERPAFDFTLSGSNFVAHQGVSSNITVELNIKNNGSANESLEISVLRDMPQFFDGIVYLTSPTEPNASGNLTISVQAGGNVTIGIYIYIWSSAQAGTYTVFVDIYYSGTLIRTLPMTVTIS